MLPVWGAPCTGNCDFRFQNELHCMTAFVMEVLGICLQQQVVFLSLAVMREWFVGVSEWVMLAICWPIWVSFVDDLLAYKHVHFVGSLSPGSPAGWVQHRTVPCSMMIYNTVMTGLCMCMQSYCPSCSLHIKVPEWNVIFNCMIRTLWSARSQLSFSFHTLLSMLVIFIATM
jgi:hypothetical protein